MTTNISIPVQLSHAREMFRASESIHPQPVLTNQLRHEMWWWPCSLALLLNERIFTRTLCNYAKWRVHCYNRCCLINLWMRKLLQIHDLVTQWGYSRATWLTEINRNRKVLIKQVYAQWVSWWSAAMRSEWIDRLAVWCFISGSAVNLSHL